MKVKVVKGWYANLVGRVVQEFPKYGSFPAQVKIVPDDTTDLRHIIIDKDNTEQIE